MRRKQISPTDPPTQRRRKPFPTFEFGQFISALHDAGREAVLRKLLMLSLAGELTARDTSTVEAALGLNQLDAIPPYLCDLLGLGSVHSIEDVSPAQWIYGCHGSVRREPFELAHRFFNEKLEPVVFRIESNGWLEIHLGRPRPPACWCPDPNALSPV